MTAASTASPLGDRQRLEAHAELLGERIALGEASGWTPIARAPALLAAPGGGCAAVFRYGVVVFFAVEPGDRSALRDALSVRQRKAEPEHEELEVRRVPGSGARFESGALCVPDLEVDRLQLIAVALAKSVVLEHFEHSIAASFDAIEPLARKLHRMDQPERGARALLTHIGDALLAEQQMTGRVEIREKPDLLWDRPDLERFYARLEDEYELRERAAELERKLDLVTRTVHTALELLHNRRALRVEWYIVILIAVEIGLTLYEMAVH